jgi:hypothetical protein
MVPVCLAEMQSPLYNPDNPKLRVKVTRRC